MEIDSSLVPDNEGLYKEIINNIARKNNLPSIDVDETVINEVSLHGEVMNGIRVWVPEMCEFEIIPFPGACGIACMREFYPYTEDRKFTKASRELFEFMSYVSGFTMVMTSFTDNHCYYPVRECVKSFRNERSGNKCFIYMNKITLKRLSEITGMTRPRIKRIFD